MEGLGQQPWIVVRERKNGEMRAFSVDRHEDGIRAQARTVVSVGERGPNHSNFVMGATNGDAPVRLVHDAF